MTVSTACGFGRSAALSSIRSFAVLSLVLLTAVACRSNSDENELTVFAAASLTEAFEAVSEDFERDNEGVDVVLSFAGSQSLRTQIEHGANADVFASANAVHIDALKESKLVGAPTTFAKNDLVIVVPTDNPAGIETVADLPRAKRLVLAETTVPAGAYAEAAILKADAELGGAFAERVMDSVVSRELHVRGTLQKVVLGEADAAIVYRTDAAAIGERVGVIEIPRRLNITAAYPVAVVEGTARDALAQRFVDYLRSKQGAAALERHGFRPADVITAGR